MIDRASRLRWRRKYHRKKRQVEGLGGYADNQIDRHFFQRLTRLMQVRRFVIGWVSIIVLMTSVTVVQTRSLSKYYLVSEPVAGGAYSEGTVGAFTNANPLYAVGQVDRTVSKLVFSSLFRLDGQGKLVSDLAINWEANEAADEFTINLRKGVKWHDGAEFTAADVKYTFETAGHADTKSPFFHIWRQVDIEIIDDSTLLFKLDNPLAAFPYSLTIGILPKHVLDVNTPEQLRSSTFNTRNPIGTGPFSMQQIETIGGTDRENLEQQIGLIRNDNYHLGKPAIQRMIIKTYTTNEKLLEAFEDQEISAMTGLDRMPDEFIDDDSVKLYESVMLAENMVFYNLNNRDLAEVKVRQALLQATNVLDIINSLDYPAVPADGPVLKEHFTYDEEQAQYGYDVDSADRLLTEAGWIRSPGDVFRMKDNRIIKFKVYAQNTADFSHVMSKLQKYWESIGVDGEFILQSPEELQNTISNQTYDILLNGITIGPDPDIFAFWHSSQFDPRSASRLNFSFFKSDVADDALEASRSRIDPELRVIKFKPFLSEWREKVPAFALYQPRYAYISRGEIFGYGAKRIAYPENRFWNVHEWMIRQGDTIRPIE